MHANLASIREKTAWNPFVICIFSAFKLPGINFSQQKKFVIIYITVKKQKTKMRAV